MELRHLRYIAAVSEEGSLTAAATSLGIGQSTLSESVRRLEEELGTRLLYRHARGVKLTAAGELVRAHAESVLTRVDALPALIDALTDGLSGNFVLGCYHSLGAWFLPDVFTRLLQELPEIDLQVYGAHSVDVRQAVIDRECDLGLVVNALPHPDLIVTEASTDAIVFVGRQDRLHTHTGRELLAKGPLFYMKQDPFTTLVERLAATGMVPSRCIALDDLEVTKALAASGTGVAVLPIRVALYGNSGLAPLDPALPRFDDTIHLVMRYDTPRTRALNALRTLILEVGERIASGG